jgi:sec-independent protein translocase protein TatC
MSNTLTEPKTDPNESEPEHESGKMSFLDHLDELRKRLVHIVAFIGIGFVASWFFSRPIFNFLAIPLSRNLPRGTKLIYTNIMDPFTVFMKVAFLAGIFLTLPLTLYEVWKFIAPGLYRKEKKYVVPFLFFSIVLFVAGAASCYYMVLPSAFQALIHLGGEDLTPAIKIDEYLDLVNMMLLGFGLIFEMPVIVAFLSLFGLVSASFLWRKSKYSIVVIVILAAILSPTGDAFNLMLWSAPMILLYFISIGVAAIFGRRKKTRESS